MDSLKIEIVSDVMCPWCIVGYKNLQAALDQLPNIDANIDWHAFELNPDMPVEGQNFTDHIVEKYRISLEQSNANRQNLVDIGKKSGFTFNFADDGIMINSFDCHRLLTWAKKYDKQTELKLAMFDAHFTDNKRLNDNEQLLAVVTSVGLDADDAQAILESDQYSVEVREEQKKMHQLGINSVPTFIVNEKYSISGGQAVDVFKQALQQISTETPQTA